MKTIDQLREFYGTHPLWQPRPSDRSLRLALKLSNELIEGFEGADFIGLVPIIEAALLEVARDQKAACQTALGTVPQIVVDGKGYVRTKEVAAAILNAKTEE